MATTNSMTGSTDPITPSTSTFTSTSMPMETTDGGVDTTDTTAEPGTCDRCVTAPPVEWSGIAVMASGRLQPCSGPWGGDQLDLFNGLAVEPGSCECGCGDAEIDCTPLQLLYRFSCGQPIGAENFANPVANTCYDNTPGQNSTNPFFSPDQATAQCAPMLAPSLPDPTWDESHRVCAGTFAQGECDAGELCTAAVPDGFADAVCIYREGDHDCPPAYPNESSHFTDVNDARQCSECSCTPVGDFTCSTTLHVYGDDSCSDFVADVDTGECVGSWGSFEIDPPVVDGSCSAGNATLSGDVTPTGLYTVCCA